MELRLSTLAPNVGSRKKARRIGRGESSGAGKTSGRGGKGQTARTGGKVKRHFEGGQMPLYRRIPKVGFNSRKKTLGLNRYDLISLTDLEYLVEGGIAQNGKITIDDLLLTGLFRPTKNVCGVKLLGSGTLSKQVTVEVHAVSGSARQKVESFGGTVEIVSAFLPVESTEVAA